MSTGQDNEGIKKRKRKHSGTPAVEVVLTGLFRM